MQPKTGTPSIVSSGHGSQAASNPISPGEDTDHPVTETTPSSTNITPSQSVDWLIELRQTNVQPKKLFSFGEISEIPPKGLPV